jgi:hypothetical protein
MRDKLNKTMKNDVTKLLTKFGINDTLSFDNPFESMLDDTMTTGLKLSETNKATFYKLTDTITFIIPDKLDSCYSGGPMTIFVLLVDNLSFRSRDTKTWVAQGFGQVELKEDLTFYQEYEIVKKYSKDTEKHKLFLINWYKDVKSNTEKLLELHKSLEGAQLVKSNGSEFKPTGYFITKESVEKTEKFLKFIEECINDLEQGKLPSEVDNSFSSNYKYTNGGFNWNYYNRI